MTLDLNALPNDIAFLHQLVRDLAASLKDQQDSNEKLRHQLALQLRHRFGRRAETIDPAQLELFARQIESMLGNAPTSPAAPPPPAEKKNGHGRKPLPKHLPRRRTEHTLTHDELTCPACGALRCKIGEKVSPRLEYVPASLYVHEQVCFTYACPHCEEHVITSPLPPQPVEKGEAGPGLLAYVATSKFADHLPLYRLEAILARQGVDLSRSTLCDWIGQTADLLKPVYTEMVNDVMGSKVVQTDDTPVPVQDETRKKTTREGRLWVYVGDRDHPQTVYDYTPDHRQEGPEAFLVRFGGRYVQSDAYAGYEGICARQGKTPAGCWAHARRRFYDARETSPALGDEALAYIQRLYAVEAEGKGLAPPERKALRQAKSKPVLEAFRKRLEELGLAVLPRSPMGEAIHYALAQWENLTRYLEDGDLDIDNNAAERALRAIALGRKNWLFAGSDEGGRRAAILYSFVTTCKDLGIDPFVYLRDVISRVSTHPARLVFELTPRGWKAAREAAQAAIAAS